MESGIKINRTRNMVVVEVELIKYTTFCPSVQVASELAKELKQEVKNGTSYVELLDIIREHRKSK